MFSVLLGMQINPWQSQAKVLRWKVLWQRSRLMRPQRAATSLCGALWLMWIEGAILRQAASYVHLIGARLGPQTVSLSQPKGAVE